MAEGTTKAGEDAGDDAAVPPASRPGKRRVELPEGSTASPKPRRTIPSRPWWRRGRFWFGVIVVEVLLALVISVYAPRPTVDDELSGGDQVQFCAQVVQLRSNTAYRSIDLNDMGAFFTRQAEAYRQLAQVSPTMLQPDLALLAALTDELAVKAQQIQEQKAKDPSFAGGLAALDEAQSSIEARSADASAHVQHVVLIGCGIDLDATTTTTAPPPGAPGVPPTAAGTGPGPAGTGPSAPAGAGPVGTSPSGPTDAGSPSSTR